MTERPMLFSGEMVRAILDGRKTQTRRVMKPQPKNEPSECPWTKTGWANTDDEGRCLCGNKLNTPCRVGDLLWVRETFCDEYTLCPGVKCSNGPCYKATDDGDCGNPLNKWRPSIHMPRCASRITLEITGVRAERLWDISAQDAKAEGMKEPMIASESGYETEMRGQFFDLWDSLAKPGAKWADNPWVWVVDFRRAENAQGE